MSATTQALINLATVRAQRMAAAKATTAVEQLRSQAMDEDRLVAAVERIIASDPARFSGTPGRRGKKGRSPDPREIAEAVAAYLAPRMASLRGRDAQAPTAEVLTSLIEAVIAGNPDRFRGLKGDAGRGIASARIDMAGDMIVTYSDGTKTNVGHVVGRDAEVRTEGDRVVIYRGGGGISEARVLELIEAAAMPTPEVEYPRIVTTVTAAGDTTLHTPTVGKAIRVRRIKCTPDPDITDTPMMTLSIGDKLVQTGPVLYGADFVTGAVDAPLILNLESAGKAGVNIQYEEVPT